MTGRHGIIQPRLHYQKNQRRASPGEQEGGREGQDGRDGGPEPRREADLSRPEASWGRAPVLPPIPSPPSTSSSSSSSSAHAPDAGGSLVEVSSSETIVSVAASASNRPLPMSSSVPTISGAVKYSESVDRNRGTRKRCGNMRVLRGDTCTFVIYCRFQSDRPGVGGGSAFPVKPRVQKLLVRQPCGGQAGGVHAGFLSPGIHQLVTSSLAILLTE